MEWLWQVSEVGLSQIVSKLSQHTCFSISTALNYIVVVVFICIHIRTAEKLSHSSLAESMKLHFDFRIAYFSFLPDMQRRKYLALTSIRINFFPFQGHEAFVQSIFLKAALGYE